MLQNVKLIKILEDKLSVIDSSECFILGGDWNCCVDYTENRTGEGTHFESSYNKDGLN